MNSMSQEFKKIKRVGKKSDWIAAESQKSHFKGLGLFFQTFTWWDVFI